MRLLHLQADHRRCLRAATALLGCPVRAFDLDWTVECLLKPQLRRDRRGATGAEPIVRFLGDRRGHELAVGIESFRINTPRGTIRVAKVEAPFSDNSPAAIFSFWVVPRPDYRRLYRFVRELLRAEHRCEPPVMHDADRTRLWNYTIGFLRHGCDSLKRFGVAQKRGVLLLGEPGNGKTMACRWLRSECDRHGLAWRSVSAEQFENKRRDADAHELFQLSRPGVVFFDDVDMALRDRAQFGQQPEHSTFLGALDGLELRHGVSYVFTSNARFEELDPAFCRPGRIDLVLAFDRPDPELRRRLISAWHCDIVCTLDTNAVVEQTDGLSFAELEEVKKLLVLHHLDTGAWNWSRAWETYQLGRAGLEFKPTFGFASSPRPARNGSYGMLQPCNERKPG